MIKASRHASVGSKETLSKRTMKEVIEEALNLLQKGEDCVLATVVRTRGSTPQKSGAKLLVRKDGSGVGTLGGGCVEGDIWFAAKEIMRQQGGPEFKDYYLNEDIAARDGLVCGGTMYFFLDPLRADTDYLQYGKEALDAYKGGPVVGIATIVRAPDPGSLGQIDSCCGMTAPRRVLWGTRTWRS